MFDREGFKQQGWHKLGGKALYFSPRHGGGLLTGKRTIGNTTYLLSAEGKLCGWHILGGEKYYFSPEYGCGMLTGLRDVNGTTYFFRTADEAATGKSRGSVLSGESIYLNGLTYTFNDNGALIPYFEGYVIDRAGVYKAPDATSEPYDSLYRDDFVFGLQINDEWLVTYFYGKSAYVKMADLVTRPYFRRGILDATTEVADASGKTTIGTLEAGSYVEGYIVGGRLKISYNNQIGTVPTGAYTEIDREALSWQTVGNNKLYFVNRGNPARGWRKYGSDYYYFAPMERTMYTGLKNTGEGVYFFDESGRLRTGRIRMNGRKNPRGETYNHTYYLYGPKAAELKNDWLYQTQEHFLGQKICNHALAADGLPFVWYGTNLHTGVYCSGLAVGAYGAEGIDIPGANGTYASPKEPKFPTNGYKMVKGQYLDAEAWGGRKISYGKDYSNLRPGDLLIMGKRNVRTYSHTAMYCGKNGGKHFVIHALSVRGVGLDTFETLWGPDLRYFFLEKAVRYTR